MTIKNMTNEQLITAYLKSVKLNLDDAFLQLLSDEIKDRDIHSLVTNDPSQSMKDNAG